MFAAPPIFLYLVSQFYPLYLDRALIGSAIMLYVLLAWLFIKGGLPSVFKVALGALGVIAIAIGLYTHYTWSTFPNSPFRQAMQAVADQWQPDDVIIHQDKLSGLASMYYAPDLMQRYIRDEPGAPDDTLSLPAQTTLNFVADQCVQIAARDAQRVWWVVIEPSAAQYALIQELFADQIVWLNTSFSTSQEWVYNDLHVTLYSDRTVPLNAGECSS